MVLWVNEFYRIVLGLNMNRYWFLKLLEHPSICYDFLNFSYLIEKTAFKFYCLLNPPLVNFPFLNWYPAYIFLRGAQSVYAKSLSVRITIIVGAFSCQCWAPANIYLFCATPVYPRSDHHFLSKFRGFFILRRVQGTEKKKK